MGEYFNNQYEYLKNFENMETIETMENIKDINNNEVVNNDKAVNNDKDIINKKHKIYDEKEKEYYKLINKDSDLFMKNKGEDKIYDLSLKNIVTNFTKFIIEMLDDLVDFVNNYYILKNKNKNMFNEFITIFIKKERLIYTGIFFILISFIFYFMDISS